MTPSGTKIAHGTRDLAGYAGTSEAQLEPVLSALGRARILRPVGGNGADGHEIYHDVLADAVLAPNFTDYSESVNTLINSCPQGDAAKPLPLLAPTFTSLEQFKIGQGQQPSINFERLNLWHTCDSVIIRWVTTNTAPIPEPKPVVGLISMEVIPNYNSTGKPWLIDTVYSEFDAGAWLQNLVEAGICSTGAGLPTAGNATCASETVVAPTTPITTTLSTLPTATSYPVTSTDDCEDEEPTPTPY